MGAPQIVMLVIMSIGLGIEADRHGEPQHGKHSFWVMLVSDTITVAILWWGGFWG